MNKKKERRRFIILCLAPAAVSYTHLPTKGIDAVSKDNLASLIRSLSKHMTIIVVSHDLEFVAKISDRVAMIFNGQMESVDSMRNFFSNNLFYTTTINKIVRNNNSEVVLLEDLGL